MDSTAQRDFEQPKPMFSQLASVGAVQFVAIVYGFWLVGLTVVFHQAPESKVLLEIALLAGVVPALLQAVLLPTDTRGNAPGMWFLWAFLVVFLASYLVNTLTWEDLANLFNVLFVFMIGFLIASSSDTSLIRRIAGAYALLMTPYLIYINLTGNRVWGRLHAGSQPNVWGLISLNVAIGAFGLKNRILQAVCMAVVLMTMYNAQTRGSMVALVPTLFLFVYQWYVHEKQIDISWKIVATYGLAVFAFCFLAFYSDVLINDVMRLNDPYRGTQAGLATGRDVAWAEALNIWYNSPFLGVGFRKHEDFMVFTDLSSHNAYIAMLADTGFVGFLTYMTFLVTSVLCALRGISDDKLRLFIVGAIISYSFAGMFERRAINVGNSFSITFIICCLVALRLAQVRFRHRLSRGESASVPAPRF